MKKERRKFKSAEEARQFRENQREWDELMKKWAPKFKNNQQYETTATLPTDHKVYYRGAGPKIPSKNGGLDMTPALMSKTNVYTGTKVKGIGTMHKSNAVPIFSDDEAKEIASMRR